MTHRRKTPTLRRVDDPPRTSAIRTGLEGGSMRFRAGPSALAGVSPTALTTGCPGRGRAAPARSPVRVAAAGPRPRPDAEAPGWTGPEGESAWCRNLRRARSAPRVRRCGRTPAGPRPGSRTGGAGTAPTARGAGHRRRSTGSGSRSSRAYLDTRCGDRRRHAGHVTPPAKRCPVVPAALPGTRAHQWPLQGPTRTRSPPWRSLRAGPRS